MLSGRKKSTASVADPGNYSEEYIDRETIAVMNSPHAFKYGFIDDLYKEAIETGIIDTVAKICFTWRLFEKGSNI